MKLSPALRICLISLTAQIMLWAWGASLPHHIHHATHKICFILHADIPGLNHQHNNDPDASHYPGHCLLKQASIEATEKLPLALVLLPPVATLAEYFFSRGNQVVVTHILFSDFSGAVTGGYCRFYSLRGPPQPQWHS